MTLFPIQTEIHPCSVPWLVQNSHNKDTVCNWDFYNRSTRILFLQSSFGRSLVGLDSFDGQRRRRRRLLMCVSHWHPSMSGDNVVAEVMIKIIAEEHLLAVRRHVDAQLHRVDLFSHEKVLSHIIAALLRP